VRPAEVPGPLDGPTRELTWSRIEGPEGSRPRTSSTRSEAVAGRGLFAVAASGRLVEDRELHQLLGQIGPSSCRCSGSEAMKKMTLRTWSARSRTVSGGGHEELERTIEMLKRLGWRRCSRPPQHAADGGRSRGERLLPARREKTRRARWIASTARSRSRTSRARSQQRSVHCEADPVRRARGGGRLAEQFAAGMRRHAAGQLPRWRAGASRGTSGRAALEVSSRIQAVDKMLRTSARRRRTSSRQMEVAAQD
jgi:hypothetical protein